MEKLNARRIASAAFLACAAVLAATLCALYAPTTALAANGVAHSVDGSGAKTEYSTIGDAINAGYDGKTVIMDSDWTPAGTLTIAQGKTLTIDMNGHEIAGDGNSVVITLGEKSSLTLTSSQTKQFCFRGYSNNDGSEVNVPLETGGLVRNGCDLTSAGGIYMDASSSLSLDNVTVAGNKGGKAGGIYVGENCKINMSNGAGVRNNTGTTGGIWINKDEVTINMNKAAIDDNYGSSKGGGIYSDADATRIFMENGSSISGNTSQSGAGIFYNYSFFHLESADGTGYINNNRATGTYDSCGGGIYVASDTLAQNEGTIKGLTISGNRTANNGGGIYLDQRWTNVVDCSIKDNQAQNNGGGVYLDNDHCGIESCTISGNVCSNAGGNDEGGGVFVTFGKELKLTGKCTIKGNTRGVNGSADDLFLQDNSISIHACITGGVEPGSSVGVRTGWSDDARIGKDITTFVDGAYFMDLDGFYVDRTTNDGSELWQRKGSAPEAASQVEVIVDVPVTDYDLPTTAKLGWYTGDRVEVNIVWLDENGNKATKAEHGKFYRFYFVTSGSTDGVPSFADSINALSVQLVVPQGKTNPGVQDAHVDSYGQLNVTTGWFLTADPKGIGGDDGTEKKAASPASGSSNDQATASDGMTTVQASAAGSGSSLAQTGDFALVPVLALASATVLIFAAAGVFALRRSVR